MKNLSNDIIKKIEKRKIKPVPRWQYVAKKFLFWSGAAFLVILGALALALGIYTIRNIDWNEYSLLGYGSATGFAISAFPYAFVLILAAFLVSAYFLYRKTPKGHRAGMLTLAAILIASGLGLAFLLQIPEIGRKAYFQMARAPYYQQLAFTKEKEWSQPERGLLWGEVLKVDKNDFALRDADGKNWSVLFDGDTFFEADASKIKGRNVKMIGKVLGESEFRAEVVKLWDGVMDCDGSYNAAEEEMAEGERCGGDYGGNTSPPSSPSFPSVSGNDGEKSGARDNENGQSGRRGGGEKWNDGWQGGSSSCD